MPGTRAKLSSATADTTFPSTASAAAASRSRPEIPRTFMGSRTLRVFHEEITNCQIVQISLHEGADGVVRGTDDRLFVHVEAGVDQRRNSAELVVLRQQLVKTRAV